MTLSHRPLAAALLACAVLAGPASAEDQPRLTAEGWVSIHIQRFVKAGTSISEVRDRMQRQFWSADLDGGGVSDADDLLKEQMSRAAARGNLVAKWLAWDLNADGQVTRSEIEAISIPKARKPMTSNNMVILPTQEQTSQVLQKLVAKALKQDKDGDGVITFAEALAHANESLAKGRGTSQARRGAISYALDLNDDGTVSKDEYWEVLNRVLGTIDEDADGEISAQEVALHAKNVQQLRIIEKAERELLKRESENRALAESCGFPQAAKDAKILLVAGYEGQALSTVSLGGDDAVVHVANVWIERGREPLYLLLTSHGGTIWRFYGAVERVAQVVASSTRSAQDGTPRVGVVGLDPKRVFVPDQTKCLRTFSASDRKNKTIESIPFLVGRSADLVVSETGITTINLPSGIMEKTAVYEGARKIPESGPAAAIWRQMLEYNPGGLVDIDAEKVVSRLPAKPYDTLPQQAGLAQLVEAGALEIAGTSRIVKINNTRVVLGSGSDVVVASDGSQLKAEEIPNRFRIVKKMRFPAGLHGGHMAQFVLAPGVPMPDGSPGHSKVTK